MNSNTVLKFLIVTIAPSMGASWLFALWIRRIAPQLGLLDQPNSRKVHAEPTPLGGGVAMCAAVIATYAMGLVVLTLLDSMPSIASNISQFVRPHLPGIWARLGSLWEILGLGVILMLLGLWDDRRGLDWRFRLAVQFAVALAAVNIPQVRLTAFVELPMLTQALSAIWIVMLINSFNMLDNMDGLSAGVASIASGTLAAFLLLAPQSSNSSPQLFVAGFMLVLTGALLGFLLHNRPPAAIFMGDAGSYFIGFMIAVGTLLCTYTEYNSSQRHSIMAPLCVLAVPLYDLVTVLYIRINEGRSPFEADKSHFSHRLVALGMTNTQAVLTIYLASATCGLGALLLRRVDFIGAVLVLLLVLCVLSLIAILEAAARKRDA